MIAGFGNDASKECQRQIRKMQKRTDKDAEDFWTGVYAAVIAMLADAQSRQEQNLIRSHVLPLARERKHGLS